jgi:hypothetical protein
MPFAPTKQSTPGLQENSAFGFATNKENRRKLTFLIVGSFSFAED